MDQFNRFKNLSHIVSARNDCLDESEQSKDLPLAHMKYVCTEYEDWPKISPVVLCQMGIQGGFCTYVIITKMSYAGQYLDKSISCRPPDRSAYWKTIFLISQPNICCGYSK